MSLQELIASIMVLTTTMVLMGGSLGQVTAVHDETLAISSVRERELLVRAAVERALEGWPLRRLALVRTSRPGALALRERALGPGDHAAARWQAGPALVCRTRDGYRVLAVEAGRLWETQLVAGRQVHRHPVAGHVRSARFSVSRDAGGAMNGVTYRVTLSWPRRPDGSAAELTGFVGLRLDAPPSRTGVRTVREGGQ